MSDRTNSKEFPPRVGAGVSKLCVLEQGRRKWGSFAALQVDSMKEELETKLTVVLSFAVDTFHDGNEGRCSYMRIRRGWCSESEVAKEKGSMVAVVGAMTILKELRRVRRTGARGKGRKLKWTGDDGT